MRCIVVLLCAWLCGATLYQTASRNTTDMATLLEMFLDLKNNAVKRWDFTPVCSPFPMKNCHCTNTNFQIPSDRLFHVAPEFQAIMDDWNNKISSLRHLCYSEEGWDFMSTLLCSISTMPCVAGSGSFATAPRKLCRSQCQALASKITTDATARVNGALLDIPPVLLALASVLRGSLREACTTLFFQCNNDALFSDNADCVPLVPQRVGVDGHTVVPAWAGVRQCLLEQHRDEVAQCDFREGYDGDVLCTLPDGGTTKAVMKTSVTTVTGRNFAKTRKHGVLIEKAGVVFSYEPTHIDDGYWEFSPPGGGLFQAEPGFVYDSIKRFDLSNVAVPEYKCNAAQPTELNVTLTLPGGYHVIYEFWLQDTPRDYTIGGSLYQLPAHEPKITIHMDGYQWQTRPAVPDTPPKQFWEPNTIIFEVDVRFPPFGGYIPVMEVRLPDPGGIPLAYSAPERMQFPLDNSGRVLIVSAPATVHLDDHYSSHDTKLAFSVKKQLAERHCPSHTVEIQMNRFHKSLKYDPAFDVVVNRAAPDSPADDNQINLGGESSSIATATSAGTTVAVVVIVLLLVVAATGVFVAHRKGLLQRERSGAE